MKSWEEREGEAEWEERQTGREEEGEDVKQVAEGERGRGGGKKRGVVSPCVQAGAAH